MQEIVFKPKYPPQLTFGALVLGLGAQCQTPHLIPVTPKAETKAPRPKSQALIPCGGPIAGEFENRVH